MDNGATEIPGTSYSSKVVFLGSPIRYWWTKIDSVFGPTLHETPRFKVYAEIRQQVRNELAKFFLVYSSHLALKGPWNEEVGNAINDGALAKCHAFFRIHVIDSDGVHVPAIGTSREQFWAETVYHLPIYEWNLHEDEISASMDEFRAMLELMKEELLDA